MPHCKNGIQIIQMNERRKLSSLTVLLREREEMIILNLL